MDKFHKLEKDCVGFENYVNADEEHYLKALESLRKLIGDIQRENIFSPNEEIAEVQTDHLKLLMAPYYQADTLNRIMESRFERIKLAHVFYIEYLGLLNHYGVLSKEQIKVFELLKKQKKVDYTKSRTDASSEEVKEAQELLKEIQGAKRSPYEDRETKIAEFKMK